MENKKYIYKYISAKRPERAEFGRLLAPVGSSCDSFLPLRNIAVSKLRRSKRTRVHRPNPMISRPLMACDGVWYGTGWDGMGWDYACREELEWSKLELGLMYSGFFAGGLRLADTLEEQVEVSAAQRGGRTKKEKERQRNRYKMTPTDTYDPPPPRMAGIYVPSSPPSNAYPNRKMSCKNMTRGHCHGHLSDLHRRKTFGSACRKSSWLQLLQ